MGLLAACSLEHRPAPQVHHVGSPSLEIPETRLGAVASWYPGRTLPCSLETGTVLPDSLPGVAHRSMPKGTLLRFVLDGRSVVAIVNDRGPVPDSVEFDLSREVADSLEMVARGVAQIEYSVIGRIQ